MNPTITHLEPVISADGATSPRHRGEAKSVELCCFAALLLALNIHLLPKPFIESLVFDSAAVLHSYQWWRVISYPFVHVSWYHLLLDATAFLGAYQSLEEERPLSRLGYVAASIAGSLIVPLLCTPLIYAHGLCGLSGPAHGLMAVLGLELVMKHRGDDLLRRAGAVCLFGLSAKCIFELLTGSPVFGMLHFGLVGTPIVSCHAGGMLGGVANYLLLTNRTQSQEKQSNL